MTVAHRPTGLSDALEAVAAGALPVAGGTDLLVEDHATGRVHDAVVDVLRLPELRGIRVEDDALEVGAASTFFTIREDPLVQEHAPVLADAAATIGAWQMQSRATLGGNIANASPAGDSLPVLLALDAEVVLASRDGGERVVPYVDMHLGYRRTARRPEELIVKVRIPIRPRPHQAFRKVGTREAQAISKVVLAFCAGRDGDSLTDVRLAVGSVAATPVRLRETEALCDGRAPGPALAEEAGRAAEAEIEPIGDVRSTADYRRWVTRRLVRRLLLEAEGAP
ncbi:MAG: FAD binding domain-containing protein [Myxococcota bacterium]